MVSVFLLAIGGIALLYLLYKNAVHRPKNFPPGPPNAPFFGGYFFLLIANFKLLHKAAMLMSKLYKSDIIGLTLGPFPCVVANSYEGVKEIFNRQEFDGRPDIFAARLRDPHENRRGVFFQDGPFWKEQRRFVLRYLRDFGFGRRFDDLEIVINEELTDLIDLIKYGPKFDDEKKMVRAKGEALCPHFLSACSTNSFLYIMCNERVPRGERDVLNKLTEDGMIFQRAGDDYGRLLSMQPWIRYFFPNLSGYVPLRDSTQTLREFFAKIVDKNLSTYDELHERHFIDMYIGEMKKAEKNGDVNSTYFYDQFILSLVDFAFPAITAIGVQISLLFQWMLIQPEILKKIQAEIDHVVGRGRLPNLSDRINMSYTEAAVRECLRIETLVPSSIPHKAMVDTKLMGYDIPKDTIVIPGLYSFHMNKSIWNDPTCFRAERFLDDNGKLSLKQDISLPFGAGKRLCAGETFARNMLFLVLGAICQNFDVVLGPGEKLPDMTKNLGGIIISPPDFWIHLKER